MALVELLVAGAMHIAPGNTCADLASISKPWGKSVILADGEGDRPKLTFGYNERVVPTDSDREKFQDSGFFVDGQREGVWFRCALNTSDALKSTRTVYHDGKEVGPRQRLVASEIVEEVYLKNGMEAASLRLIADGHWRYSQLRGNTEEGINIEFNSSGVDSLYSIINGKFFGVQSKGSSFYINQFALGQIRKRLSEADFSEMLSGDAKAPPVGVKATVEPFYYGVAYAPFPGKLVVPEHLRPSPRWGDARQALLWNIASTGGGYDISTKEVESPQDQSIYNADSVSTVAPLQSTIYQCIPFINNKNTKALTRNIARALQLDRPLNYLQYAGPQAKTIDEETIQILRWGRIGSVTKPSEELKRDFQWDIIHMLPEFKRQWRLNTCRRALIFEGEISILPSELRMTAALPQETKVWKELAGGQLTSEEQFLFSELFYDSLEYSPTIPHDFAKMAQENCYSGEPRCIRKSFLQIFLERAWYVAIDQKLIKYAPTPNGLVDPNVDFSKQTSIAGRILCSIWIGEFMRINRNKLLRPASERVKFIREMQSLVISNMIWANRFRVFLQRPWSIERTVPPRDYEPLYRSILGIGETPPKREHSLLSPNEESAFASSVSNFYLHQERVVRSALAAAQLDFAAAFQATESFSKFLAILEKDAFNEAPYDRIPTEREFRENIITSSLPIETIEIEKWYVSHGTSVLRNDPMFAYSSDDNFRVSFTVDASHAVANARVGSPIALALLPKSGLTPSVRICGEGACLPLKGGDIVLSLAALHFRAIIEANDRNIDETKKVVVRVYCARRCRELPAKKVEDFFKPGLLSRNLYDDALLLALELNRDYHSDDRYFSEHLLKSSREWIAVPMLVDK